MKHKKAAAVVAGSVFALGAAVPAFASQEAPGPSFSADEGLNQALQSNLLDSPPVDGPQVDGVVDAVQGTADHGEQQGKKLLGAGEAGAGKLLGGLPLP